MSYPINLNIEGKLCIVLGGGKVAYRKVTSLLNANAKVQIISENFCEEIKSLSNEVELIQQSYIEGCLPNGFIFIAATNDKEINFKAAVEASNKNMLVNVVNKNDLDIRQFEVPSVIRTKDFMLTISSYGHSPSLSKQLRIEFEKYLEERQIEITNGRSKS